ncbi:MAG: NTP transferase domain-containing protein [Oligoflexia bacterium]|nr:NTP transferase domain-containing protein [Oligoflexia bacterium]
MQALILAGGKGTRLRPFTTNIPKPLVPIDDMPILEIVLRQLKHHGFNEITLAINHLADLFVAFFKDGKKLDLNINYSIEDHQLGTAGPLSIANLTSENFLLMNGDILTTLNYKDLYSYHIENRNDVTIAVHKKEIKIDLGVLKIEGGRLTDYIEKPQYFFDVSMGIYVMHRRIIESIPHNQRMEMPELILKLKKEGRQIGCYYNDHYWLDIGRMEDYEIANNIFQGKREEFLPR